MASVKDINSKKKLIKERLLDLLEVVSIELLERIQSGEASPQDISNAIRLCKENDVDIRITEGQPLAVLDNNMPFEGQNVVNMDDRRKA